jgi:alpha-beta hydrolase superfamily lysophospholipase
MKIYEKTMRTGDGFSLFYREAKAREARAAMILLPGMSLHSEYYVDLLGSMAEQGISVMAPDHRGRGRSVNDEWKKGDMHSLQRLIDDVGELRKSHESEWKGLPHFIGGISFGGLLAVLYASQNNNLRGVVIAGPPYGKHPSAVMEALNSLVAAIAPDARVGRVPKVEDFYVSTNKKMRERVVKDPLFNGNALRATAALEIIRTVKNLDKAILKMTAPLLILYGNMDKFVTDEQISVLKEKWGHKDCTVHLLEGVGHDVFNEQGKEEAFKLLNEWMEKRI